MKRKAMTIGRTKSTQREFTLIVLHEKSKQSQDLIMHVTNHS